MLDARSDHPATHDGDDAARDRFLTSHRAVAVCAREFGRLVQDVTRACGTLAAELGHEPPDLRLAPDRCIVQLGPAALTVAWMRATLDFVSEGRLLVIVWEGTIAHRTRHVPERGAGPAVATAESVWEEELSPSGSSESTWEWQPVDDATRHYESSALADHCVAHLREALAAAS